ncbi:hypothetical protein C8R43DRAFT_506714 [Mycena crocata]|nr:hypothetical protein C8R43DRAFT_506714 [Mycena crocata]
MDNDSDLESPGRHDSDPIRAEGLWFTDCGLIIRAENTIFRVSRDVLASQSIIFHDMLALPARNTEEMIDGCPFVCLPDTKDDVTAFLKALFCYGFFEPHPAPTTLATLTGVLRMSHKYEVAALYKCALTHVSACHPSILEEWKPLDEVFPAWFNEALVHDNDLLGLILLARRQSIDWILPTAFYRVCERVNEDSILISDLDLTQKVRCMTASRHLETSGVTRILDFLWKPLMIEGCQSLRRCGDARMISRREAEKWRERDSDSLCLMPLEIWDDSDWAGLAAEVCKTCLSAMKESHHEARQVCWDGLPSLFGLPQWTELEKMKADALR